MIREAIEFLGWVGLKTALFVVLATGLTVLALEHAGLMPSTDTNKGRFALITVTAFWCLLSIVVRERLTAWAEDYAAKLDDQQERAARDTLLVRKIALLRPTEFAILAYYKRRNTKQFRALCGHDGIESLYSMRLIERHEATDMHQARHTIPDAVFDAINVSAEMIVYLDRLKTPPWESHQW